MKKLVWDKTMENLINDWEIGLEQLSLGISSADDSKQNQNTETERLERCRQTMELRENGLWEQIHGIVLLQYQQDINEEKQVEL